MTVPHSPDPDAIFLNVPYDKSYEPKFIALIASLVALGRKPRCVLEIPELGQGRLRRIVRHLQLCRASVHDLSSVGAPARFNMPFELGLAYCLNILSTSEEYDFVLLEKTPHRISRTLSDLDGHSPFIHEGTPAGVITCMIEAFAGRGAPSPNAIYSLWRRLMPVSRELKRKYRRTTVFSKPIFESLVVSASLIASAQKMIPPNS